MEQWRNLPNAAHCWLRSRSNASTTIYSFALWAERPGRAMLAVVTRPATACEPQVSRKLALYRRLDLSRSIGALPKACCRRKRFVRCF